MPKNKPPAFQFYVKAYLSGAARRMTLTGLAAYINLLSMAWDSDPIATLPSDPERLRRLVGASVEEWRQIKEEVLENFKPFEDDPTRIINKRLRQQWLELSEYSEKLSETASERGKKGAAKRWSKKNGSTPAVAEPANEDDFDAESVAGGVDIDEDAV